MEHAGHAHRRDCPLSGCGGVVATGQATREEVDARYRGRTRDRLEHGGDIERPVLERFLAARGRDEARRLQAGAGGRGLTAAGADFSAVAPADPLQPPRHALFGDGGGGRVHVVPSSPETVRLGVFDTTLPDVIEIEPGDTLVYPDTWSHFLDRLQPGVPIEELTRLRLASPGRGPHSIIGPVAVRGAEPGDLLEVQFLSLQPVGWAATFNNPGALGTGALPDLFAEGQVKYVALDLATRSAHFDERIRLPLAPFQGTFGVAPPDGFFGMSDGVVSSVPPGPHGGNIDLRELGAGTRLFLPVWRHGGKLYTGDSHALQGDGEVNLTALETAMREVRVRVLLHARVGWRWPFAETGTHWIALGMDPDLRAAHRIALLNAIEFLVRRAGLTQLDAYALCSVAVSFRVTQVVDIHQGVHAMIPKGIFHPELAARMSIA